MVFPETKFLTEDYNLHMINIYTCCTNWTISRIFCSH